MTIQRLTVLVIEQHSGKLRVEFDTTLKLISWTCSGPLEKMDWAEILDAVYKQGVKDGIES